MRSPSRRVRLVASVLCALVLTATLTGAAPAVAVASVPAAGVPDFTPSPNAFRKYMINITGKVLGKATPNKWKAEQIANDHQYNQDWETLNAQFGQNPANPNYVGQPDSYGDYLLRKAELDQFGGTNGKPLKVPATGSSKFGKSVGAIGGAVTAITGMDFGITIGNGVMGMLGFDPTGMVCGNVGDDTGGALASLLSGVDCDAWALANDYTPNIDAVAGITGGTACSSTGFCTTLVNVTSFTDWQGSNTVGCFTSSVMGPQGMGGELRLARGTVLQQTVSGPNFQQCNGKDMYAVAAGGPWSMSGVTGYCWANSWQSTTCQAGSTGIAPITESSTDPDRFLECSVVGTDGNTYTAQSAAYKESGGKVAPPECPELPAGVTAESAKITEKGNGTANPTVWEQDVNPEYLEWWQAYPECRTGACKLDLINKKDPAHAVSCFDAPETCEEWFSEPNKTSSYECRYGTHLVDLTECYVYSGTFKPERISVGAPYSDPLTGEWSGGQNSGKPDRDAFGAPVQSPEVARSCNGMNVTGFDPVGFVMRPIQCALEWAFVPRPTVVQLELEKGNIAWSAKPPAVLAGVIGDWDFETESVGGCSRSVTLFGATFDVWNFCPGASLEWVGTLSRLLISATLTVALIASIRRSIGGAVDYRG